MGIVLTSWTSHPTLKSTDLKALVQWDPLIIKVTLHFIKQRAGWEGYYFNFNLEMPLHTPLLSLWPPELWGSHGSGCLKTLQETPAGLRPSLPTTLFLPDHDQGPHSQTLPVLRTTGCPREKLLEPLGNRLLWDRLFLRLRESFCPNSFCGKHPTQVARFQGGTGE